jgi:hypothetical protein
VEGTDRKLTSPVQTLDFVHSVSDTLEGVIEPFFPSNFLSRMQDEVRIWSHVVLNLQQTINRTFVEILWKLTSMAMTFNLSSSM